MKVYGTGSEVFKNSIRYFDEIPKQIPASSIMVATDKKVISIMCIYYDAGIAFIHGLFKSDFATEFEFRRSIIVLEKFIRDSLAGKIPVICFSNTEPLKKLFVRNKFNEEKISMLVREIQ